MLFKNGFKSSSFINMHSFYKKYFIFPWLKGGVLGGIRRVIVACNLKLTNLTVFKMRSLSARKLVLYNYPIYCVQEKSPLLKRTVFLYSNKDEIRSEKEVKRLLKEVEKNTQYDTNMIENHIKRIASNK